MATTVNYRLGEVAILMATFRDASGDLVKPSGTITFTLKQPDGSVTTYVEGSDVELVEDEAGVYYVAWVTALPGPYEWRMVGTGDHAGATGGKFRVY